MGNPRYRISKQEEQEMNNLRSNGCTLKYIAFKFKRDVKTVFRHTTPGKSFGKWTKEEMELLSTMVDSGCTYVEIAEKLGRSHNAVYCRIYNLKKQNIISPIDRRFKRGNGHEAQA